MTQQLPQFPNLLRRHGARIQAAILQKLGDTRSRSGVILGTITAFPLAPLARILGGPDVDRDRIESMPKVRKSDQSSRSGKIVAANDEARTSPKDFIVPVRRQKKVDAMSGRRSGTVAPKANPEELKKAVARATAVFGEEDAAFRWLGTPVAALDFATPILCLGTHQGAMRVNDVLTQIEHGVW